MQHASFPFRSAREQIDQIRAWNIELRWGFTESELIEAERVAPSEPAEGLCAPILVPYLPAHNLMPGCVVTFHALWRLAARSQQHAWLDEAIASAGCGEALRPYDTAETAPGLRWEVIDFGAGRGERAQDMIDQGPRPWPHAGILAAAAYNPGWVRAINGTDVPYVYLPGYLVRLYPRDVRGHRMKTRPGMLLLSYAGHLRIDVRPLHFKKDKRCAIPSMVELVYSVT